MVRGRQLHHLGVEHCCLRIIALLERLVTFFLAALSTRSGGVGVDGCVGGEGSGGECIAPRRRLRPRQYHLTHRRGIFVLTAHHALGDHGAIHTSRDELRNLTGAVRVPAARPALLCTRHRSVRVIFGGNEILDLSAALERYRERRARSVHHRAEHVALGERHRYLRTTVNLNSGHGSLQHQLHPVTRPDFDVLRHHQALDSHYAPRAALDEHLGHAHEGVKRVGASLGALDVHRVLVSTQVGLREGASNP
mmetsp:Transcript_13255/g.21555  ORF Transcript_13255/g.21555 Transcript_13255/m.21555 type:complete len:251 (+) Transcript_13255:202-954(+)